MFTTTGIKKSEQYWESKHQYSTLLLKAFKYNIRIKCVWSKELIHML